MKFEYLVKPRIPIRSLPEEGPIVRPKILNLEKEQVLGCLRCGAVLRRFSAEELVRVTKDNLDSLHVTKLQYKGVVEKKIEPHPINDNTIVSNANTKDEEEKKPEPKEVTFGQPIPKTEESKEEAKEEKNEVPVEEPVVEPEKEEEPAVSEPEKVSDNAEEIVEEEKAPVTEEVTDKVEETPTENITKNDHYTGSHRKKHH